MKLNSKMNSSELNSYQNVNLYFSVPDYVIFGSLLLMSGLIGLYFGFISKRKQDNKAEYLIGSKSMSTIPVALSLIATHVSSVSLLGVPAEVYLYGTQYWAISLSILVAGLALGFVCLPVFYEFESLSIFGYLEKRFDRRVRQWISGLYFLHAMMHMPLMIYAPALAFSQVTGFSLHTVTAATTFLCIFYTMFGGIRAVVWADTLQFGSMIGALLFLAIFGTYIAGGLSRFLEIVDESGRLVFFNLTPDPTVRQSFWMMTIGYYINASGISPECVQRFQSLPSYKHVIRCLIMFTCGHIIIRMLAGYCGIVIFARYHECDPYILGIVKKVDQIFPYFVLDAARNLPGIPGLFVAGVFSAGLSSISTVLNCIAGCVHQDFMKKWLPNTSDKTDSTILKILVFIFGLICVGLVFVVERLGNLFSLGLSLSGIATGSTVGVFVLGMLVPKANAQGAFWSSVIASGIVFVLCMGAQMYIVQGKLKYESKPFYTYGCDALKFTGWQNSSGFIGNPNSTTHILNENFVMSDVPVIFRLGFMYYAIFATIIVLIGGYMISKFTGGCNNLDERLLTPFVRKWHIHKMKEQNGPEVNVMYPLVQTTALTDCN